MLGQDWNVNIEGGSLPANSPANSCLSDLSCALIAGLTTFLYVVLSLAAVTKQRAEVVINVIE